MKDFVFNMVSDPSRSVNERADAFAARHLLAARARAEQKERDRAEVCADINAPAERIRAWEKLCGLRLPTSPDHPVLKVVAADTRLTLFQVLEQQRARRLPT